MNKQPGDPSASLLSTSEKDVFYKNPNKDTRIKLIQPNHAYSCLGFGKLFNVLLSFTGREASRPMHYAASSSG